MGEQLDPASVLEEAADLLLIHGVCRNGQYSDGNGRLCAVGAIAAAMQTNPLNAAVSPATSALRQRVSRAVTAWNDRSKDDFEVIDTLRRAAKDLRNAASC